MQFLKECFHRCLRDWVGYLRTQKNYEILRTVLYLPFRVCLLPDGSLMAVGRIFLTIVAVPGMSSGMQKVWWRCLCSYAIRCNEQDAAQIAAHTDGLDGLYDMVFTSYEKNYVIHHMTIGGNTLLRIHVRSGSSQNRLL